MEDTRVSLVEYLASDFCINGVPAGDVEFCDVTTYDNTIFRLHVSSIAEICENCNAR